MPGAQEKHVQVDAKPAGKVEEVKPKKLSSEQKITLIKKTKTDPRGVLKDVSKLGEKESGDEKKVPVAAELKNKILGVVKEIGLGKDIKDLSYIGRGQTGEVYKLTVLKNGEEVTVAVKIGNSVNNVGDIAKEQLTLIKVHDAESKEKYGLGDSETGYTFKRLGGDSNKNVSFMEYIPIDEQIPISEDNGRPLENLSMAIQYAHHIHLLRQADLANLDVKLENLHNINGKLRITDIGLVSNTEEALKSTNQKKGVLNILGISVSPDFSNKVLKLIKISDRDFIPYSQYSQGKKYEISQIIKSEEFQKGPAEIRGLILKSLNLLKQEKKPEELVSKEGYEELLLDMVALSEVKSINIPKALKGIKKQDKLERISKLEQHELPPLETSSETIISSETIKKLESAFVQSLPKRIDIGKVDFLLLNDQQKKALYGSILPFSSLKVGDSELKESLIPNFETFITKLQSLDDPKKIGFEDELVSSQYLAMRSTILGLNGKQSSDFSPEDISLIKTKMNAIKNGKNKEEVEGLLREIAGKIQPPSTVINSTPL